MLSIDITQSLILSYLILLSLRYSKHRDVKLKRKLRQIFAKIPS